MLPATRITNRSPSPWSKTISAGTRESEQPRMIANGCCPAATSERLLPVSPSPERLRSETKRLFPSRRRARASVADTIAAPPGPSQGRLDGPVPPSYMRLPVLGFHAGLKPGKPPPREKLVRRLPHPRCQSGQAGGAERGGLHQIRSFDRDVQHIRLELHQPVVGRSTSVHPESWHTQVLARRHRGEQLRAAVGHRLQRRAH